MGEQCGSCPVTTALKCALSIQFLFFLQYSRPFEMGETIREKGGAYLSHKNANRTSARRACSKHDKMILWFK